MRAVQVEDVYLDNDNRAQRQILKALKPEEDNKMSEETRERSTISRWKRIQDLVSKQFVSEVVTSESPKQLE